MNQLQLDLVQRTFRYLMPIGDTVAEVFYRRLFELDPTLRALFPRDMREQGRALMHMMAVAVQGLSRPDTMLPAVEELGRRHAGYGVAPAHYETFGTALLMTLRIGLGDAYSQDVHDAWTAAYAMIAQAMQRAASGPAHDAAKGCAAA